MNLRQNCGCPIRGDLLLPLPAGSGCPGQVHWKLLGSLAKVGHPPTWDLLLLLVSSCKVHLSSPHLEADQVFPGLGDWLLLEGALVFPSACA